MNETTYLDLERCAQLLGMSRRQLQRLVRAGEFAAPQGHDAGQRFWEHDDVLRWWAARGPDEAKVVPVDLWPAATEPAPFLGAVIVSDSRQRPAGVLQRWHTPRGVVGLYWDGAGQHTHRLHHATLIATFDELLPADPVPDVLVVRGSDFGILGPALWGYNIGGT